MAEITIQIASEEVEDSELDAATRRLRDELSRVDGCEVSQPAVSGPAGTKAMEMALLGQLLLSAIGSGGIAVTLISVLRDWLIRHKDFILKIKRKPGEIEIELSGADAEKLGERLAEVKTFLMDAVDD